MALHYYDFFFKLSKLLRGGGGGGGKRYVCPPIFSLIFSESTPLSVMPGHYSSIWVSNERIWNELCDSENLILKRFNFSGKITALSSFLFIGTHCITDWTKLNRDEIDKWVINCNKYGFLVVETLINILNYRARNQGAFLLKSRWTGKGKGGQIFDVFFFLTHVHVALSMPDLQVNMILFITGQWK